MKIWRRSGSAILTARGRKKPIPGSMNKLERLYSEQLLLRQQIGEVAWFAFEAIKLRLADNTFYTPDFFLMLNTGELECHETKGHWEEDARVKIKVAASMFPFRFVAIKHSRGAWAMEEF